MSLTLVNLSGFQAGIEAAESGINVQSFVLRYYSQFKTKVQNYQGQFLGFYIPNIYSRELRVSGHTTGTMGSTGLLATIATTAMTFANDVADFLATATAQAGGFYVDEITETQEPNDCRKVDMTFTSDALCP